VINFIAAVSLTFMGKSHYGYARSFGIGKIKTYREVNGEKTSG